MITVSGTLHKGSADIVMAMPPAAPSAAVRPPRRGLPAGLHQDLAAICGTAPGLTLAAVTRRARAAAPGATAPDDIEVAVDGWSPSLHRLAMQWHVPLRGHDPESPEALRIATEAVTRHAAVQRQRAASAAAIGIDAPLPTAGRDTDVSHLTCDRSALAIAALVHGATAPRVLAAAVATLHNEAIDQTGEQDLPGDGCFVAAEPGSQHLGWNTELPQGRGGQSVTLIDAMLVVGGTTIPEALMIGAAGRRLGDVVQTHPLLDDRIIEAMTDGAGTDPLLAMTSDMLVIRLRPDRVRIGDLA